MLNDLLMYEFSFLNIQHLMKVIRIDHEQEEMYDVSFEMMIEIIEIHFYRDLQYFSNDYFEMMIDPRR